MEEKPFPSLRSRRTIENLNELLGCSPPAALVSTLEKFHTYLETTPNQELWDLVCFELIPRPIRYYQTPPEVTPFANMGVDGIHLGWVDRAPELASEDFPVARVSPMDAESICEVAPSIPETFSLEMSLWAENDSPDHAQDVERVRSAARTMGIDLIPEASRAMYGPNGKGRPISVSVPAGYRFVPAIDNIGVLAPAESFQLKEESDLIETAQWPIENVSRLAADLEQRFPGTALFHYKCLWWRMAPKELWADGMKRAYLALDRPSLAANVDASV